MKKSSFTDEHVAFALKQAETGTPVADITSERWRPANRPSTDGRRSMGAAAQ